VIPFCLRTVRTNTVHDYVPLVPRLFDDNLTLHRLHAIFSLVNAQSAEEEGGDEDAAELVYGEWVQVNA
tara:strand:- start:178 stop:384 length:207 start_codon:yes stop_codon:yes gene_type:complete